MRFKDLFGVFSRRPNRSSGNPVSLPNTFRSRVLMSFIQTVPSDSSYQSKTCWEGTHKSLLYLVGRPELLTASQLSKIGVHRATPHEEIVGFATQCEPEHFFDFIEIVFRHIPQSNLLARGILSAKEADQLVDDINSFFRFDDLPYSLTDYVRKTQTKQFFKSEKTHEELVTISYPQIIRREDEILHLHAIEPALKLLRDPAFASANREFLEALTDYRKGDLGDCLTKCGSALESTMKIICSRKGIEFDPNKDAAAALIRKLLANAQHLPPYFEQPLTIIATLRNKLSNAHGAGLQKRTVEPHIAKFTVNSTATAILLLLEEYA